MDEGATCAIGSEFTMGLLRGADLLDRTCEQTCTRRPGPALCFQQHSQVRQCHRVSQPNHRPYPPHRSDHGRQPLTRVAKALAAASALFALLVNGACSNSTVPLEGVEYDVPHKFIGKDGKAARDLSGIACAPNQTVRHCLVIDDESDSAQWATLDGTSFVSGDPMPLVGESAADVTFGARPEVDCPNGDGTFGEVDGEAVAFAAPYYYVVGSHGCSRKKGEFRASSFILARLSDEPQGKVETTFRLADVLRRAGTVSAYLARISMATTVSTSKVSPSMVSNSSSACVAHPLMAGRFWCGRTSARCSQKVTHPARRPLSRFRSPCRRARASGI